MDSILSESQQRALTHVLKGENVFITGGAGTGKSFLIEKIRETLYQSGQAYYLTATTGSAAYNIGGTTLHSYAGIGLGQAPIEKIIKDFARYGGPQVMRWQRTKVLIVDEISMLDPAYFEKINLIAQRIRKKSSFAFGGIQLILVGDFLQLPPIANKNSETKERYVFETETWRSLRLTMVKLDFNFRQQTDLRFRELLHSVRLGAISQEDRTLLESRDISKMSVKPLETTKLFSYRADVERINNEALTKIDTPSHHFKADIYLCETLRKKLESYPTKNTTFSYPVDASIELKAGASVLLCCNLSQKNGLFNGCKGVITKIAPLGDLKEPVFPFVQFYDNEEIPILPHTWEQKEGKQLISSFTQIPLMLAYSATIHRSQGLTLNNAQVDMKFFENGQAYVAISRVRQLEDLYLTNVSQNLQIKADPVVIQFYSDNALL